MRCSRTWQIILALALVQGALPHHVKAAEPAMTPRPGNAYQTSETRALEADDAANPGLLWVDRGEKLWSAPAGRDAKSCATCHNDAAVTMRGTAARFPQLSADETALINLEARINLCRTTQQNTEALKPESDDLLALTAYLTRQSQGMPRQVRIDGSSSPFFARGQSLWQQRQGQLNLACSQCHDDNAGKRLRGDVISQGQSDGWPAYRIAWQTMGSLHRRLRACSIGVRAEVFDYGAPEYLALELYLAWRGATLPVTAPGVRR